MVNSTTSALHTVTNETMNGAPLRRAMIQIIDTGFAKKLACTTKSDIKSEKNGKEQIQTGGK